MTGTSENSTIVRKNYLLIGNGKLSRHLDYYLKSQNIFIKNWARKTHTKEELTALINKSDYILLAISDSQISSFIKEHSLKGKKVIHFSGALTIPETDSLHPLMTFNEQLYSIDFYKKIPFVGIKGQPTLKDIFPTLENPYAEIENKFKPLYHALCVMANNFTTVLWQKVYEEFQNLSLPTDILEPYLEATLKNIKSNPQTALTGPLARRDLVTLAKNLESLKNDSFHDVYKSFVLTKIPNFTPEATNDHT